MFKVDLHTHSTLSHDGGISEDEYKKAIAQGTLDYIAITDHNEIEFAKSLHKRLGDNIIVGEEIDTGEGEVIGLYLTNKIGKKLGLSATLNQIKKQRAISYIPHPFEKIRKGVSKGNIIKNIKLIDIIEIHNQRALTSSEEANKIAEKYKVVKASGSDSHSRFGLGKTYMKIANPFTKAGILDLLQDSEHVRSEAVLIERTSPLLNKIRKKIKNFF